ncbi:MAG: nucleotidyltransferase [Sphingobacteriales bacterium]|nr:MAG: nucleotidyltransferase [Sphingobacteriales bacterium]
MARSIAEIKNSLVTQVQQDPTLGPLLTSSSKVAIWNLWCFVVAVCQWTIENLQDLFKSDVNTIISMLKPHTSKWYAQKVLDFQFGFNLPADSDVYDNTGVDDATIAASKVVAYVAVVEADKFLRIKVAGTNGTDLVPLTNAQLTALIAYLQLIKDAGVKLLVTTGVADGLKISADIYYNALVLNQNGNRLDGTSSTPVQDAANQYLKNLPFNGVFTLQNLANVWEQVDGVTIVNIKQASAQYGSLPYTNFAVYYLPDSGYLRFLNPNDLQLNFIPYSE